MFVFVLVFTFVVHGQRIQGHWIVRMRRLDRHNYVSCAQCFILLFELYLSFLTDHFSFKICDQMCTMEFVCKIEMCASVRVCGFLFHMQNHMSIQPWR